MEDKKPRFQHVFSAKIREPPPSVEEVIGKSIGVSKNNDKVLNYEQVEYLASLLSIYRNKKEETFRYILLDKNNTIVDHLSLCSHNNQFSQAFLKANNKFSLYPSNTPFLDLICEHIKKNDLKLILAHNHPSGNVEESIDDIKITSIVELKINQLGSENKFLGHVILDHGTFNFYTPNLGWNKEDIILTNNINIKDKDPLMKKSIKPYFNYSIKTNEDTLFLYNIAKKLDAKENWNFELFTPFFCLNHQNTPIAVKFIDNETILDAAQNKNTFSDLRKTLTKSAKTFGINGFIPIALNEKTIKSLDNIARQNLFIDVIILENNKPMLWSSSFPKTDSHYPHFFSFPEIADVRFEQSKNFKKTYTSKEIKKNFFYVER